MERVYGLALASEDDGRKLLYMVTAGNTHAPRPAPSPAPHPTGVCTCAGGTPHHTLCVLTPARAERALPLASLWKDPAARAELKRRCARAGPRPRRLGSWTWTRGRCCTALGASLRPRLLRRAPSGAAPCWTCRTPWRCRATRGARSTWPTQSCGRSSSTRAARPFTARTAWARASIASASARAMLASPWSVAVGERCTQSWPFTLSP